MYVVLRSQMTPTNVSFVGIPRTRRMKSQFRLGRLHGLAVACWTTDHYHPRSNPGVGISEGCFVFHFVSLPLEVARPI